MSRSVASASGRPKGHASGVRSRADGLEKTLKPMRQKPSEVSTVAGGPPEWDHIGRQSAGSRRQKIADQQLDPSNLPGYYRSDYTQDPAAYRFLPLTDGFQKQLSSEDIALLELARNEDQRKKYDDWLARNIQTNNIHEMRWLRRIEPEFFERRKAVIDDSHRAIEFLTKIRVYGPQSLEDLETLYVLDQRKRELISDPNHARQFWQGKEFGNPWTISTRDERVLPGGFKMGMALRYPRGDAEGPPALEEGSFTLSPWER